MPMRWTNQTKPNLTKLKKIKQNTHQEFWKLKEFVDHRFFSVSGNEGEISLTEENVGYNFENLTT